MNCKVHKGNILRALLLLAIIFCCFCALNVYYISSNFVATYVRGLHCHISCSNFYSSSLRSNVEQAIHKQLSNASKGTFDLRVICTQIKKEFPLIKTLQAHFQTPQLIEFEITGVKPAYVLNNQLVLGDKKRLFSLADFEQYSLGTLPLIHLLEPLTQKVDESLYTFLHTLPEEIFKTYNVTYNKQTEIILLPRDEKMRYKIITDVKSIFDEKKRKALASIESDTLKRDKEQKRKRGVLVFDIRFKNNILAQHSI